MVLERQKCRSILLSSEAHGILNVKGVREGSVSSKGGLTILDQEVKPLGIVKGSRPSGSCSCTFLKACLGASFLTI